LETGVVLNVLLSGTGFLGAVLFNDFISSAHEVSIGYFGIFLEHAKGIFVLGSEMFFDHLSHVFDGMRENFLFFLSLLLNVLVVLGLGFGTAGEDDFGHYWGEVINDD
jgi:hypothetical protein